MIDSHCHLDADDFDNDREQVLERAHAAGISTIVVPGTDLPSSARAVQLASTPSTPRMFAAVGIHPHSASEYNGVATVQALGELASGVGVVAIGETGLDFHYNFSPPPAQLESLRAHVRLARQLGLPLIVHCRNAETDLLALLQEEQAAECGGVVHCFTGTWETASQLLDLGFFLGFTGIVTFRNAAELRAVVARVPLSRLLLETDSPYLAPIPHRGKRNEPAYLPRVAEVIAEARGISVAEVAAAAADNTRRCFKLPA